MPSQDKEIVVTSPVNSYETIVCVNEIASLHSRRSARNDGFRAKFKKGVWILSFIILGVVGFSGLGFADYNRTHVILISVDGLRPDALTTLGAKEVPNFYQLMTQGVYTLNARTDPDKTVTMPNHTGMLTGRGVMGKDGHNYTDNRSADRSLHENKGSYVASVFDSAKTRGLTTGLFASKEKFNVFINSYGKSNALGQSSKIDVYQVTRYDDELTMNRVIDQLKTKPVDFMFVHIAGPDVVGHAKGWSLKRGSAYLSAVRQADVYLGRIIEFVETQPNLKGSTVIVLTSDHGGFDNDHDEVTRMENYRIPFIIWGKGVAGGGDLYKMNMELRRDPGTKRILYGQEKQPIRNADAANLVCALLGLPPVEGSTIGNPQAIKVNN